MARKQEHGRQSNEGDLAQFLDALALEGRSEHSIRSYRRDLEALLAALPGPLNEVRPADLRELSPRKMLSELPARLHFASASWYPGGMKAILSFPSCPETHLASRMLVQPLSWDSGHSLIPLSREAVEDGKGC